MIKYLNLTIEDDDELIGTFVYDEAHTIATTNDENIAASDIHKNTTRQRYQTSHV